MPSPEFTDWIVYYRRLDRMKAEAAQGDEAGDQDG